MFHSFCWTDLDVYLCYDTPSCQCTFFVPLQSDFRLVCVLHYLQWVYRLLDLSIFIILEENLQALDCSISPPCSCQTSKNSEIDIADIELQQVSPAIRLTYIVSLSVKILTVGWFILQWSLCFSDFGPWVFCYCLAGEISRNHSGCESFPCRLETSFYCREGGLWATPDKTCWDSQFPGHWDKTGWQQLAHCSSDCWICKCKHSLMENELCIFPNNKSYSRERK